MLESEIGNGIGIGEYVTDGTYIFRIEDFVKTPGGNIRYTTADNIVLVADDIEGHSRKKIDLIKVNDYVNSEKVTGIIEKDGIKKLILSNGDEVTEEEIKTFLSRNKFELFVNIEGKDF